MANALIDVSNNLADAVEHAGRSVVSIAEGGQHGVSGTVWREGVVVAADHTIRGREEVTVLLPNGATTEGRIAGRDPGCDIAVVKLRDHGVPNAKHADSPQPRVGHIVLAVGRRAEAGLNASYGVISALGGPWRTWQGGRVDRYFRLDLLPFTGFSGGPLIDAQGGVLGINTSGPRRSILTIPLSTVDRVVTQLLEKGRVTRGYLGAGLQRVALPKSVQQALADKREVALLIITLASDGPAERAGLVIGDVLLSIEDRPLADTSDLQPALDPEKVGKPAQVQVLRGGKLTSVEVVIGERP